MKNGEFREHVEAVRAQTDILDVIGTRVELRRDHKGLCPFHEERDPSFSVNPSGQYYHCFGCGEGGDVFDFLMKYENKSFREVLEELAVQVGITGLRSSPEDRQRFEEERSIEEVLTETARFYHQCLTAEAKAYLMEERGFTEEMIVQFRLGYASGDLRAYLVDEKGFSPELCIKAGVSKQGEEGSVKDYFYRRIVFPNVRRGRVVHLTSRSMDGHEPKYLHLPGEIRYLYNEDALANDDVYIAEGIPDCITAVQSGYPAVAILGTSGFRQDHVSKFSRCKTVYVCLDADRAGRDAAVKIGGMIGERARIVELPDGLDLNEYFKNHSKADFDALVDSSKTVISHEIDAIPVDTKKTDLPRTLDPILERLAGVDPVQAEAYLSYEIKPRFTLRQRDIDGYRQRIASYRKEDADHRTGRSDEPEAEVVLTANFDGLVDLVLDKGKPAFLIKEGDALSIVHEVDRDGIHYIPPPLEQIPWLLPNGDAVMKHHDLQKTRTAQEIDETLYDDLLEYHRSISELPADEYYDLVVTWDFHTYLFEYSQYSPIIGFFAVPERGKSRTGKGMIHVAHRGIHVESLRDPYLVRVAHDLHATLFFDVKDVWKKAEKNGSEDILLHRFERGARVPRVMYPDRGAHRDIVYYSVFGPTIIATNENVHKILETRIIPIHMPEGTRRFENDVTDAVCFRERLVAFRARHLGEELPAVDKPAAGRLGDILKPLRQVIRMVKPGREEVFMRLVKTLEEERLVEKSDTLEARILEVVSDLEDEVEHGIVAVKRITDEFNGDKPEKLQLTPQRVGRRLTAMGFKKAKTANGNSAILWEKDKIERMKNAYGLGQTPETPESSEPPGTQAGDTDVSGVSGVCPGVCKEETIPF